MSISKTASPVVSRSAKPLDVEQYFCHDKYTGTLEQLIQTGKFKVNWFPGHGRNKATVSRRENVQINGASHPLITIRRKTSTSSRYTAICHLSSGEENLRRFPVRLARAKAASMEMASNWLRSMANSNAEFIAHNLFALKSAIGSGLAFRPSGESGYSFTQESIAKFESSIATLVSELRGYDVAFDQAAHNAHRLSLAADAFERHIGCLIDQYSDLTDTLGIDRENEKAKFVSEALAISLDGYCTAAINKANLTTKAIVDGLREEEAA